MISQAGSYTKYTALTLISFCLIGALSTWFSATVILPELSDKAQLSGSQEIWLSNGVQLGFVTGALIIAVFNISDIVSLTKLIGLCCTGAALANALLIFSNSGGQIVALRFLTGAALAGVYPPCVKLIATWFKKGRGIALGTIIGAVFGVGIIAYMEIGIIAIGWSGEWRQFFNGLIILLALLGHRLHGERVR